MDGCEDTTGFSAETIAEMFYYLAETGYGPEETIDCIGPMAAYADAQCVHPLLIVEQFTACMIMFDIEVCDLPELLDLAKRTVQDCPLSSEELFKIVRHTGPGAVAGGYSTEELFDSIAHTSQMNETVGECIEQISRCLVKDNPLPTDRSEEADRR